jgi:hypothetical protein
MSLRQTPVLQQSKRVDRAQRDSKDVVGVDKQNPISSATDKRGRLDTLLSRGSSAK